MIPKTISASGLKTASGCLSRYKAEYIDRGRGMDSEAAKKGSCAHECLEMFVKTVIMDKSMPNTREYMIICLEIAYQKIFMSSDYTTDDFAEIKEMVLNFQSRKDWFDGVEYISLEVKDRYELTDAATGTVVPMTYIMDVVKRNQWGELCVDDYKTSMFAISNEDLKENIQAKLYALIMQLKFPDEKGIWVTFDFLRHSPVSVWFTKATNFQTWYWVHAELARIIAADPDEVDEKPTLNPECNWCVKKATCPALKSNAAAGGIFGLTEAEMVDLRVEVEGRIKGNTSLMKEIDAVLSGFMRAEDNDNETIQGTLYDATMRSRTMRNVNVPTILEQGIFTNDILDDYMPPPKMTLKDFEEMLKDERVTHAQIQAARSCIEKTTSSPTIKLIKRT